MWCKTLSATEPILARNLLCFMHFAMTDVNVDYKMFLFNLPILLFTDRGHDCGWRQRVVPKLHQVPYYSLFCSALFCSAPFGSALFYSDLLFALFVSVLFKFFPIMKLETISSLSRAQFLETIEKFHSFNIFSNLI